MAETTAPIVRASMRGVHSIPSLGGKTFEGDFTFIQMADTQLGLAEDFKLDGMTGWAREVEMMEHAAHHINRLRPAFVIVCGDLTNEFPVVGNAEKRAAQIEDFRRACSMVDASIPLICVCGNHDVGNIPTDASIAAYRESFGDDYFAFWCRGVRCIVANSQLWKDATGAPEAAGRHDTWFRSEVKSAKESGATHTIAFGHVPIFLDTPAESDSYFNLSEPLRSDLLNTMADGGCTHYFCGHYHRNAGGVHIAENGATVEVVVTAATGTNIVDVAGRATVRAGGEGAAVLDDATSGLRVVMVTEKSISHRWYSFEELDRPRSSGSPAGSPSLTRRHGSSSSRDVTIRRIRPGEWRLYKTVRLAALKESPHAFQSTYASNRIRPDASWRKQCDGAASGDVRCTFVAIDPAGNPVGIASMYRDGPWAKPGEVSDRGELAQFWVAPAWRGARNGAVASQLLDALLDWARERRVALVTLGLQEGNRRASSFYVRHGFVRVEPDETEAAQCCPEQRMAMRLDGRQLLRATRDSTPSPSPLRRSTGAASASGSNGNADNAANGIHENKTSQGSSGADEPSWGSSQVGIAVAALVVVAALWFMRLRR